MNKGLFNDVTMKELLGEAWEKNNEALKGQNRSFSFTRHEEQAERRAIAVLREAMKKPDLLDAIKERASIRWSNGLSDSLYSAVLCNLKPLNELAERDSRGEIILKPCSDWQEELRKFSETGGFNEA